MKTALSGRRHPPTLPEHSRSKSDSEHGSEELRIDWFDIARIAFVALCAIAVWLKFPNLHIIGAIGIAVGVYPIAREALDDVLKKKMTMELSMTIALCAALLIGEL